jgi:type IV pilus assembly protein PilX
VMTLPTSTSTNTTVSYVIHRLCNKEGNPSTVGMYCSYSPHYAVTTGNSNAAGSVPLKFNGQSYYRITSRIEGPRNTVSYVQTIIAL